MTPAPLPWREAGPYMVADDEGHSVCAFAGSNKAANMHRAVASVNACEGLPVEWLEQGVVQSLVGLVRQMTTADFTTGSTEHELLQVEAQKIFAHLDGEMEREALCDEP